MNCHSYALYSINQTATTGFWMNNPNSYYTDGSCKNIGIYPTRNNQIASWKLNALSIPYEHSGVVSNYTTKTIRSKWGQGPVMEHYVDYSPYSGTVSYFTK